MKTKIALLTITALFTVLVACLRATETVPQTQTVLKSYFNPTGATPGTNEFNELIDTMFWYINSTYTNSQNASMQASNAAAVTSASFLVSFTNNGSFLPKSPLYVRSFNIASNAWTSKSESLFLTNYFATPMQDGYYGVHVVYNNGCAIQSIVTTPIYCAIQFNFAASPAIYSAAYQYYGPAIPANSNLCYVVFYQ